MAEYNKAETLALIRNIAQHDSHSDFRAVYNLYYKRLFRQALYYFPNPETAREVVADVFVSLWQSRKILDKVKDPDAYFFISLKHTCSKLVEKRTTSLSFTSLDDLTEWKEDHLSDRLLVDHELQTKYKEALKKLPPRCAEVFRLVREEKKKYAEVAELLNISPKTVDNQLNKAVKLLYSELKEHLFCLF